MEKNNKTWLLLRGLTRGQLHWCDFPEKLAKKFPGDQIKLIDLPGNGLRCEELSPLQISDYVKDLRTKISPDTKLHVIAFSFGAMVAIEWIKQFPSQIEKAFLINTSISGVLPFYKRLLPKNYLSILNAIFKSKLSREKIILQMTSNNLEVAEKVLLDFEKIAEAHPVKLENLFRQLMAANTLVFPEVMDEKKIFIFTSINDRLVSSENSLELAKRWKLNPIIHPWAGHDLVLDDPEFVLTNLQVHVSKIIDQ